MAFITGLPLDGGLNGLMVCLEKLTKLTHLIPCFVREGALTVPYAAELFFAHVVYFFGIPHEIVYDQDPHFTFTFWNKLSAIVGTRL